MEETIEVRVSRLAHQTSTWSDDDLAWYLSLPRPQRIFVARRLSAEVKILLGGMMYDRECRIIRAAILNVFPRISERTIVALTRLALARK